MAYTLSGLFKLFGTVYRPEWSDPCGGSDITGYSELDGTGYKPRPDTNVGSAAVTDWTNRKNTLDGTGYVPTLIYEPTTGLPNDCGQRVVCDCQDCEDAGLWTDGNTPLAVTITFTGITKCGTNPEPPSGSLVCYKGNCLSCGDCTNNCIWTNTKLENGVTWYYHWQPIHGTASARLTLLDATNSRWYFVAPDATGTCEPSNGGQISNAIAAVNCGGIWGGYGGAGTVGW